MIHLSNKAKQYGLIALKVLILTATFWFIYERLNASETAGIGAFYEAIKGNNTIYIPIFIIMATANWLFEIQKWKLLVRTIRDISFKEAGRQCLTSLSASLATPNRIKALFFAPKKRKKVMALNFVSNTSQMFVTLLFGIPGVLFFVFKYSVSVPIWKPTVLIAGIILMLIAGYYFRKKQLLVKGLTIENVVTFIKKIPFAIRRSVVIYAMLRYLIFSSLFYLLLLYFGASIDILEAIPLIVCMYLLSSVIPTFFLFDVAIKGGVALWLFTYTGVQEAPVLCAVMVMWLLNFVIPAIWGSYFVARFTPVQS